MKTVITSSGHVADIVTLELSDDDARKVTQDLANDGIRVEPVIDVFRVLHLWALAPASTQQEVQAIGAFRKCTDARIAWHKAVAR